MVTGGFRLRAAMEQAITGGGADLIGLGRPMCVMTDAPAQLLAGLEELPRYENQLALLPSWLSGLSRIKAIRPLTIFAVMYWYYAQLEELGRHGRAKPSMSVFAATKQVMGGQKALLTGR
jgi:hypothetical protein